VKRLAADRSRWKSFVAAFAPPQEMIGSDDDDDDDDDNRP
jgi:hypothetical protein